jgi:hypothetical protein
MRRGDALGEAAGIPAAPGIKPGSRDSFGIVGSRDLPTDDLRPPLSTAETGRL